MECLRQYSVEGHIGCDESDGGMIGWGREKMFCVHRQSSWDNSFSGYQIMNWLSGNVFVFTIVCMRYRLPGDIERQ